MIGWMTERGLPIVDGAPACPFVAFDDDRDERAAGPDHRHRCYAEPNPAPRALAHQEAYCLSSAFPVCPTFQDWARREAARSRQDGPRPTESDAAAIAAGSQRNPPRNWAAPPPWASRAGASAAGPDGPWGDDEPDPEDVVPTRGRGLSGSFADRIAGDPPGPSAGAFQDDPDAGPDAAAPPAAATRASVPPGYPVTPPAATVRREPTPSWRGPETDDDEPEREFPGEPAGRRHRERDPSRVAAFAGNEERAAASSDRRPSRRRDPAAPEWEAAPPPEAYPTLRARRLPELSVPPLLVAVLALALAAAVLFALPGLLGFGNPSADASPTPRGSALPTSPLQSLPPTPVPAPTQQTYVVQSGDTMSRIADRFGVPLGDLIAANQETIPNPDQLQIGQTVIIPVPLPSELPAASAAPAAP
jgi:hypothetical protein